MQAQETAGLNLVTQNYSRGLKIDPGIVIFRNSAGVLSSVVYCVVIEWQS
jgi:hypothetical protein